MTPPPRLRVLPRRVIPAELAGRTLLTLLFALALITPALATSAPALARAQESVSFSTAEAAPADSLVYLVSTLDDSSQQWQLADALLDRAGLGEAIDQSVSEDLKDENGEDIPLDAFLGGEVAIIVGSAALDMAVAESMGMADIDAMMEGIGDATPAAVSDEPAAQGFAVVLDANAPDTAWAAIREAVEDETPEESTYEGATILYSPPATADDEGMATARAGDLILFATAPADLEPVIDTIDGRAPALTTVPELTTAREALPDEFLMFGFFNNEAAASVDLGPLETAASQLEGGFSALTVAADQPGFRMESVSLPAAGESPQPAVANFDSELVRRAPADTVFFMSAVDLGATGTLDAIGAAALGFAFGMQGMGPEPDPNLSPEEAIAAQYEGAAQLIGINLQTELFQQLVGEYGGWLSAAMDENGEVIGTGLFASGTDDGQAVANALMQLSLLIQSVTGAEAPVTTREINGDQVYVLESTGPGEPTVEFGVVGDQLVFGDGRSVESLTGPPAESLADSTRFQAVMGSLPAAYNGLVYVDLVQAAPLLEAAENSSSDFGMGDMSAMEDASESCEAYPTQAEAQTAYDAAEPDTFDLDQDFDGEVCEDFFAMDASAAATPGAADVDNGASDDPFANVDYSAVEAFALVSYGDEAGLQRTSSMLYIAE